MCPRAGKYSKRGVRVPRRTASLKVDGSAAPRDNRDSSLGDLCQSSDKYRTISLNKVFQTVRATELEGGTVVSGDWASSSASAPCLVCRMGLFLLCRITAGFRERQSLEQCAEAARLCPSYSGASCPLHCANDAVKFAFHAWTGGARGTQTGLSNKIERTKR